jgi:hypothetical protein
MAQSYYSWCGTRLHLLLDDDLARNYNRSQVAFIDAQIEHRKTNGRDWRPSEEYLDVGWAEEERNAFNAISEIINLLVKINGGTLNITEAEMTTHKLVKL